MGIFHEQVQIVNRTATRKEVIFDGQRMKIEPNYDAQGNKLEGVVNTLPVTAIPYALAQNPIMGTESVVNPSSFRSYIGVVFAGREEKREKRKPKSWHDCSFVDETQVTEITRVAQAEIMEELVADVKATLHTRGKKIPAAIALEAGGMPTTTPFDLQARG